MGSYIVCLIAACIFGLAMYQARTGGASSGGDGGGSDSGDGGCDGGAGGGCGGD